MNVKAGDLKAPYIYGNSLSEQEKASVKFKLYLNGKAGNKVLDYSFFIQWLEASSIEKDSFLAGQVECGFPIEMEEGIYHWERVCPA